MFVLLRQLELAHAFVCPSLSSGLVEHVVNYKNSCPLSVLYVFDPSVHCVNRIPGMFVLMFPVS